MIKKLTKKFEELDILDIYIIYNKLYNGKIKIPVEYYNYWQTFYSKGMNLDTWCRNHKLYGLRKNNLNKEITKLKKKKRRSSLENLGNNNIPSIMNAFLEGKKPINTLASKSMGYNKKK